jgi:hypothetical protein
LDSDVVPLRARWHARYHSSQQHDLGTGEEILRFVKNDTYGAGRRRRHQKLERHASKQHLTFPP